MFRKKDPGQKIMKMIYLKFLIMKNAELKNQRILLSLYIKRNKVKMVKLDSSEIREDRPKDKPMFDTLVRISSTFQFLPGPIMCMKHTWIINGLHRQPHSFKPGDLVLYDWPKQCVHKLSPMFKGPFVIVRPVGAVCYEIKFVKEQRKFKVHQHLRACYKRNTLKLPTQRQRK
ncbi:hypothetical protein AVEN_242607-1 [Araneus ventricosus]|uniref:Uncharacterized protein n=1 Tax=Araneus ventricosus TaxID=182803 RepID=A0A4Y2ETE4_ARAVE|nr:hypothetical protein AVEN_242607-1 [Araneus ventricosus]